MIGNGYRGGFGQGGPGMGGQGMMQPGFLQGLAARIAAARQAWQGQNGMQRPAMPQFAPWGGGQPGGVPGALPPGGGGPAIPWGRPPEARPMAAGGAPGAPTAGQPSMFAPGWTQRFQGFGAADQPGGERPNGVMPMQNAGRGMGGGGESSPKERENDNDEDD